MLIIDKEVVKNILFDYGINLEIQNVVELQRSNYDKNDPTSKEVRLINKVELSDSTSVVVRFKNEDDVTLELVENQNRFAEVLRNNGIATPFQYKSKGNYANWYCIEGYEVIVTVEEFVENEIRIVDEDIAFKTGELLAKTHNISEANKLHVQYDVLFNPFMSNDLFDFESFCEVGKQLMDENKQLFVEIVDKYNEYMEYLSPIKQYPSYAVQGDISDCNLYITNENEVGLFDYNRAGDNILWCDAVMQAVFEARLMDYPDDYDESFKMRLLNAFLKGYCSIRKFTQEEKQLYPYLYTIINAFWAMDIHWSENSLVNTYKNHDMDKVHQWLEVILERLMTIPSEMKKVNI